MTLSEARKRTRSTMHVVPWLVIDRMVEGKVKPAVIVGKSDELKEEPHNNAVVTYVRINEKTFRYDSVDKALQAIGRTRSPRFRDNLRQFGFHRFNNGCVLWTWGNVE